MNVTVGFAFVAVVDWLSVPPVKLASAAQVTVDVQVAVPLVMVYVVPTFEQPPLEV